MPSEATRLAERIYTMPPGDLTQLLSCLTRLSEVQKSGVSHANEEADIKQVLASQLTRLGVKSKTGEKQ